MQNLTPVVFDDEGALRSIIPRKPLARRARLTTALQTILARYAEYRANTGELSTITPSSFVEPETGDCKSLYTSDSEELAALKKAILEGQLPITRSVCQYCAIGEPKTFDHYASKGRFPEYSMYSLNLVPCCGTCNLDKGEAWTEKGYRHFINFYFDTFLRHVLLHAELEFQANGEVAVVFLLRNNILVNNDQFLTLSSHYEDLDLFFRYAERAAGTIAEVRNVLPALDIGIGELLRYLQVEADSKAQVFGPNYWQAAVYRCLSVSDRFVEECLGNRWLPRARADVINLLALPDSVETTHRLRILVRTRAWRLHANRGFMYGYNEDDWFNARAELGLPSERWL